MKRDVALIALLTILLGAIVFIALRFVDLVNSVGFFPALIIAIVSIGMFIGTFFVIGWLIDLADGD